MIQTSHHWIRKLITSPTTWVAVLTLIAFWLRIWRLEDTPPGWRDDELINSLVISQKALDGDWALYYPDASGHEGLYHILNAIMLWLFGPGVMGIRLLSVILGTLTVPLTYLVGDRLFGWKVGLVAAAALTVSFWSLMYSRIGIRHISLTVFMLGSFYFYLRAFGLGKRSSYEGKGRGFFNREFLIAGIFLGLGFYTYFAARGIPAILLATTIYVLLFHRTMVKERLLGVLLMFGIAAVIALPLWLTLSQQPESESRVQELAVPLVEAQSGNFQPLFAHITQTASMFHGYGDAEWLYNIPFRPVFGPITAILFWIGVITALWYAFKPLTRLFLSLTGNSQGMISKIRPQYEIAAAFLLIWWLVGISPGFISVPPASLGHTIIAQSASFIILALPIFSLQHLNIPLQSSKAKSNFKKWSPVVVGIIVIGSIAWRDLPDYYLNWPERGMTRFLYRADIHELAQYLNQNENITDFAVGSQLAGPWDKLALATDLSADSESRPRWYYPARAVMLTNGNDDFATFLRPFEGPSYRSELYESVSPNIAGDYDFAFIRGELDIEADPVCFQNGFCLLDSHFDKENQTLQLTWELTGPLLMPEVPLTSNPAPPGVYSGPRLSVFAQLLDSQGQLLANDDGLWVDPTTLVPGDRFQQVHYLTLSTEMNEPLLIVGLYDPKNGIRVLTEDGRDHLEIVIN
jgi:4-amino-4-deoxy-L-arabinose transferase-like glycosyltransferase